MAELYINYGINPVDMTYNLLKTADIGSGLRPDTRVCIKPNLVVSRPAEGGATTHSGIVEGIVRYFQDLGLGNITIAEGSWVGDSTRRAFANCGYDDLAGKYGVKLLDTKKDKVRKTSFDGLDLQVCSSVLEADYLINVPVLKGHCQTMMTCCLKNMKGCIPDSEKRRYHSLGLDRPIAALNGVVKPHLHIVDSICGDLTFEEGGNPVESNRILLGFDPVLLDSYCARLMGYDPDEIGHLRLARQYGLGKYWDNTAEIRQLNREHRPLSAPGRSREVQRLATHIQQDAACSACYAALIFALHQQGIGNLKDKIKIGQGFADKQCGGIGVGNCASGCDEFVKGCPPTALDIVQFLKKQSK